MTQPRAVVENLHGFKPGLSDRTVPELQQMLSLPVVDKLSFNESPFGPSPLAKAAICQAAENVHRYHDPEGKALKVKLAQAHGVEPSMVFLGNGGDETVSLLMQGFLNPKDEVIMQKPTFGQYASAATLAGGVAVRIPVLPDLSTDFDAMLAAITGATKMVFVCNPNNPTGLAEGKERLCSFLRQVPEHILIILDEAYAEYVARSDYASGIALLNEFKNIVVVRTFSKVFGLAGLRLGYGIASPDIVAVINRIRNPFNFNCLALAAGEAALADTEFTSRVVDENCRQRERLHREFTALGYTVYQSDTNFLFVDTHSDSAKLCQSLAEIGIIIRSGHGWDRPSFIRVSVGNEEQNTRLLNALL